jgi:predicted aspartyl protease
VRIRVAYDPHRTPPAPILPIRLGRPGTDPNVLLTALVDTGADATVIPPALAMRLDLPVLAEVAVAGTGGLSQRAMVHAAVVEVGGSQWPIQVLAVGGETLVGRDLLNQWVATLRGPAGILEVETPPSS